MMLWMAPFTMEVECKIVPVRADWSPMTLPDATRCSRCRPLFLLKSRLPKSSPELQTRITQLAREGSPPTWRLLGWKLSRKSNQVARGRIRQFESYMPSQPVSGTMSGLQKYARHSDGGAPSSASCSPTSGALGVETQPCQMF
jgi:hypothetical protein